MALAAAVLAGVTVALVEVAAAMGKRAAEALPLALAAALGLVAVAAAVGREGSRNGKERQRAKKRPPAAAGVMVVLRKR